MDKEDRLVHCEACGSSNVVITGDEQGHTVVICQDCGVRREDNE